MVSGATSRRRAVMPSWGPRQAKAAVQVRRRPADQGLWSSSAIRRRRRPSTRTWRVGRTKRRPRDAEPAAGDLEAVVGRPLEALELERELGQRSAGVAASTTPVPILARPAA